ncbi:hypothetical protein ABBQ38_003596 [Trebouxia sp. C0009 RCD-2024]
MFRRRQKRSHRAPPQDGVHVPTAIQTGQHAANSPQHNNMQPQPGSCQGQELAIQQALRGALEQCMCSEQLPKLSSLQQVRVVAPSQKMAKKLPGGVKLTTPAPTVLAGMYRKAVRAAAPTPDTVAGILAAALNARFQQPEWCAAHGSWAATVLNGHLNFHTTSALTTETAPASHGLHAADLSSAAVAGHIQDQALSPQPKTAAAVLQNHSSHAAAETRLEAQEMPAGNSPKSWAGSIWTGTALNCSLKQAIADQPSSSSAQLTELDCAPAEHHPSREAQQEPALTVTATTPPAALPSTPPLAQAALRVASDEAATVCTGMHADKTHAVGAQQQKSHGRGQHASSPSNAVAAQGTAAGVGARDGAAGVGGVAAGVGAVEARAGASGTAAGASGTPVAAGGAAQQGPDGAEAGSQVVAAQAENDAATDRGSKHDCTAGRGVCRGSHHQGGHPARHLEIRMVPAGPELVEVEYPLYYKYQTCNHHDEPGKLSKKQFLRFLIESPFPWTSPDACPSGKCPPCGMGTFHQQYWLDGKLIAVGVLDVLPSCLSSVYFFWDNDYAALAPGKFSALKEAEWVREAARTCPALHYYYMGFYIHSCHKMQYKADYQPSDLLCPERLCWVPFDRVKAALDEQEYQVLSDLPGALEGLCEEHALSPSIRQQWEQCRLSSACVAPHVVDDSLIFWRDAMSPYSLVRFGDLAERGAPQALLDELKGQLQDCHRLAGPAAAQMAFVP